MRRPPSPRIKPRPHGPGRRPRRRGAERGRVIGRVGAGRAEGGAKADGNRARLTGDRGHSAVRGDGHLPRLRQSRRVAGRAEHSIDIDDAEEFAGFQGVAGYASVKEAIRGGF
jgi:hypothetical protein